MTLRTDGDYTVYLIEHLASFASRMPESVRWAGSNFDHFGTPKGFSASDPCWQKLGIHGTFKRSQAVAGLRWLAEKHNGYTFRIVEMTVSQKCTEVARMCVGEKEKTS